MEAFLFFGFVDMDMLTLVLMLVAAILGSLVMAGIVSKFDRKKVRYALFVGLFLLATVILCKIMGVGPVPACRQAMKKADLKIEDIDLVEANEAFAAQSIAVARELGFDMAKVNVNGGAISIGHPVGASGARIIVTLLHEMQKRDDAKLGMATLCIGGGIGEALIVERV